MWLVLHRFRRSARLFWVFCLLMVVSLGLSTTPASGNANQISWITFGSGAEYTWLPYFTGTNQWFKGNIFVARVAPYAAVFRIYYHPGHAETIQDWAKEMPGAALVVNASFFNGAGQAMGLVRIGDSVLSLATKRRDSGLFSVTHEIPQVLTAAANDNLLRASKDYSESFESYPLLISGQQFAQFKDNPSERARRTIVAQDHLGNILIILTSSVEMSLTEAAYWLQSSGLNVVAALNLDGGSSSEIHINSSGDFSQLVQGNAAVPSVLAVFLR